MNNYRVFSGTGGAIAVVCILFLPVIGCGNETINGIEIVQSRNVSVEIKFFIVLSVIAGVAILFLKQQVAAFVAGIIGLASLLFSYLIAHNKMQAIELKMGAYLAMIGFVITAVVNAMGIQKKNVGNS